MTIRGMLMSAQKRVHRARVDGRSLSLRRVQRKADERDVGIDGTRGGYACDEVVGADATLYPASLGSLPLSQVAECARACRVDHLIQVRGSAAVAHTRLDGPAEARAARGV